MMGSTMSKYFSNVVITIMLKWACYVMFKWSCYVIEKMVLDKPLDNLSVEGSIAPGLTRSQ